MLNYIIISLIFLFLSFIIFLFLLKLKIEKFEEKIIKKFKEKNNQIPSIFEVTKKYLTKHKEIFNESLILMKKDFSENSFDIKLKNKTNTYKRIHNELNFIFRVCNKHNKLNKDEKYLLIRDIIINKSMGIGIDIELYKKIIKKYNNLIIIKNYTLIGLFFPLTKKENI